MNAPLSIQIGRVTLTREHEFTYRGYECAAWSQTIRCAPQSVPLFANVDRYHAYECAESETRRRGEFDPRSALHVAPERISCKFEGEISDAHFESYFCGNRIGSGNPGDKYLGNADSYYVEFPSYAFREEFLALNLSFPKQDGLLEIVLDGSTFDIITLEDFPTISPRPEIRVCRKCRNAAAPETHPDLCCDCAKIVRGLEDHRLEHRYAVESL